MTDGAPQPAPKVSPLGGALGAPRPAPTAEALVRARALRRVFGEGAAARAAVDGVDLEVFAGEALLLFGPSGCGKSTLLALLGGLDRAFSGDLSVLGVDLARADDGALSRLRAEGIGFVFQAFHLLGHLTVLENVLVPSWFSRAGDGAGRALADPRRTAATPAGAAASPEARARALLQRVGLADRAAARPAELSGGQRQRVAIARALLPAPRLLLCDEPTGNLDRATGESIIDLFAEVHDELGTTLVVVTHEERLARIATRTLHMEDGRLRPTPAPAAHRGGATPGAAAHGDAPTPTHTPGEAALERDGPPSGEVAPAPGTGGAPGVVPAEDA